MLNKKKIVSMIPIKMNSERVKDKNIRTFYDGKPLVSFIAEAVLKSCYIDEVYVYCSEETIREYIPSAVNFLKRPSFLDANDMNCNDIIREFIKEIDADIYSVNHSTAPFTTTKSIDNCIEIVADNSIYDSSILVRKVQTFIWDKNGAMNFNPHRFPRTQDLDPLYTETSGAHVFTKQTFENNDSRYGEHICYIEASEIEGIDIDTEEDMFIAQAVYKYKTAE